MKMKKTIFLLLMILGITTTASAYYGPFQHLTPQEFKKKQQAYITEKAELTAAEAEKFFPLYFELQDKKRELNDKVWKQLHRGKDNNLSEAEYEQIMLTVYDLRIESAQLEKTYFAKFRKILTAEKIFQIQKAEARFHRELVKGAMREEEGRRGEPNRKRS